MSVLPCSIPALSQGGSHLRQDLSWKTPSASPTAAAPPPSTGMAWSGGKGLPTMG